MSVDLFGQEIAEPPSQRFTTTGKAKRREIPKGYFQPPGTGPVGETCGSCKHISRHTYSKTYLKCVLNAAFWTRGYGSDIRAKSPACRAWTMPDPVQWGREP